VSCNLSLPQCRNAPQKGKNYDPQELAHVLIGDEN